MCRLRWLTILILSWSAAVSAASALPLSSTFNVEHHDVRDGLAHSAVNAIVQTPNGYIWFATQEGLSRFDGVRFTTFDYVTTPILGDSYVQALSLASGGGLLVGTWGGGVSQYSQGAWSGVKPAIPASCDVYAIATAADGTVWVGTTLGLYALSPSSMRRISREDGLGSDDIRSLLIDPDGSLWVGSARGGVSHITTNGTIRTYTAKRKELVSDDVYALARRHDGTILAGNGGVVTQITPTSTSHLRIPIENADSFVQALAVDARGRLWIGTSNDGLFLEEQGVVQQSLLAPSLISNIQALAVDRDGTLWVGSGGWGVYSVRERRTGTFSVAEGLPAPLAWAVLEARDGSIWVGTDGGGASRISKDGHVLRTYGIRDVFSTNTSTTLCEGPDGSIWVGGEDGQLRRISPDGVVRTFQLGTSEEERAIRSITLVRDGTLWVASALGVIHINASSGATIRRYTTDDGLPSNNIRAIAEDASGTLWITSSGGLSSLTKGAIRVLTSREKHDTDLFFSIFIDHENLIWLAARTTGIAVFRNGTFHRITTHEGLYHNAVYAILEDPEGYLWLTSSRGVARVRRRDVLDVIDGKAKRFHSLVLTEADGMRNRECNGGRAPAIWRTDDGRILVPTMDGISIIPPSAVKGPRHRTAPLIEAVRASVPSTMDGNSHIVPPSDGKLTFTFTAPTFSDAGGLGFRYKLSGFDSDWIEAGTAREATYTNLPPGAYDFHVSVIPISGTASHANETSVHVVLTPHLYQTAAAKGALAILLVLLVWAAMRLRTRQLLERDRVLSRLVNHKTTELRQTNTVLAQRTTQLEEANRRLELLSHLDGLTCVANRLALEEHLALELRRTSREDQPLSVLFIDIDFFKRLNDSSGHQVGDDCLRKLAEALSANFRAGDLFARYGGEEFVVVLPKTDAAGAYIVAERLRARAEALAFPHPDSPIGPYVTVSIGVATVMPREDPNPAHVILLADRALYGAKHGGRNRVVASDEG